MFNASGGVTHQYSHDPFGAVQSASGSPANPLRFAARELAVTTGLYYFRARWYDPVMGRFVSEDPIGLAGGINHYAYALNDPVNLGDPTGLCVRFKFVNNQLICVMEALSPTWDPPWYSGFFASSIEASFGLLSRGSVFDKATTGSRWQDDGSQLIPDQLDTAQEALACWLNGLEGEVQVGAYAAGGAHVGAVGFDLNVDILSAHAKLTGTGRVSGSVTSGVYGTVTLAGVAVPFGVRNTHEGGHWTGWKWPGRPTLSVPVGGKAGFLAGGGGNYNLADAFVCWLKSGPD
jgi:RHS repeat-associated protein